MEKLTKTLEQYKKLKEERPSTIRSTVIYGILRWVFDIPGSLLFLLGIALLIASFWSTKLAEAFHDIMYSNPEKAIAGMDKFLAVVAFLLSFTLLFLARLCKRIVSRNLYIMKLELLVEGLEEKKES